MKYKIIITNKFKKDLKKIRKRNLDEKLLKVIIDKLANGETLDSRFYNHALLGNYKGHYECHIKSDWLLIYFIDNINMTLNLSRTGSHSDLF